MNKIITELPKGKSNRTNWGELKHTYINILYENKQYTIYVSDYKSPHLYLNSEVNTDFRMFTGHFMDCKFKELLGLIKHDYLYKVGNIIEVNSGKLEILKQVSRNKGKFRYLCRCLNDNYEFESYESNLSIGYGCPVCAGQKIMKGVNDVATTDTWMVSLFKNIEDAYIYSHYCEKEVEFICPICKEIINNKICNVFANKSISCPSCSDGISFPNKIMFNLLTQIQVDFINEYNPDWAKPRKYDFYIPSMNLIIEMDGGLGHGNNDNLMNGQTKEESKQIDDYKDKLAEEYGIEKPIRIDCDYSNMETRFEYIKQNILDNKRLNKLFNLINIDWDIILRNSCSSIVKKTWELFNKGYDTNRISRELKISDGTIRVYLKRGNKLNECDYKSDEALIEGRKLGVKRMLEITSKKIIDTNNMDVFPSISEMERTKKLGKGTISNYCSGKNNTIRINKKQINVKWLFLEDYYYLLENNYDFNDWDKVRIYLKSKYKN
jgi:hypothetical protein